MRWHEVDKEKIVRLKSNIFLKMYIINNQKNFDDTLHEFTQDLNLGDPKLLGPRNNFRD